jgi:hypothetical protein
MSKYRVKAEFTIEIHDRRAAEQVALARTREAAAESIAEGEGVVSNLGSPEVASYEMAQQPRAVASMVAYEILIRGIASIPWATLSSPRFENEPLD